jgi:hypothetical protein
MADWKAIAQARGLDIPAAQCDRIAQTLDRLTDDLAALPPLDWAVEPDAVFDPAGEEKP